MSASPEPGAREQGKRKEPDSASSAPSDDGKRQLVDGPLVLCSSGIYGEELVALEKACERLGARLVSEWSDSVTHLVMTKLSWTPKLLYALAGLVTVVNPQWVQRAADRAPDEPLPDASDPELGPKSAKGTDSVAVVRPERTSLFKGRRYIRLPGAPAETQALLSKMGAEVRLWPETLTAEEQSAYFEERIAEGFGFVLSGDEKWPVAAEAKAAIAAGADVISPLLVRTSLVMARVTSARHLQASATAMVRSGET